MAKHKIGIVVGKFYPLHTGHINLIQTASTMCEKVIVVVSHHAEKCKELFEESNMKTDLTAKDKLTIVQKSFQNQRELIVPILVDESKIPQYPNGWQAWSDLVKETISTHVRLNALIPEFDFNDVSFFINENDDVAGYKHYFGADTVVLDSKRSEFDISATKVRNDPFKYWDFIPRASRYFLTPKIAIVGGESSGKSMLVDRLAQLFATTSVHEKGRTITESELGGDESALQFKTYGDIGTGHYADLKFALTHALKVVFSDTDFVTTQGFCLAWEGKKHPIVEELIKTIKFDLTILLSNDTEWVDDGMRLMGSDEQRKDFQNLLKSLYKEYNIPYVEICSPDYTVRYETAKVLVNAYLRNKISNDELQALSNKTVKEMTAKYVEE